MRNPLSGGCYAFIILLVLYSSAAALGQSNAAPPFDIDSWLKGPSRHFPGNVELSQWEVNAPPSYMVEINTILECSDLRNSQLSPDMHLVAKIAGTNNRWLPNYAYSHVSIQSGCRDSKQLTLQNYVLLRPGRFTIAIIAYDPVLKKGYVLRKRIQTPALKLDLDYGLPEAQFISAPQDFEDSARNMASFQKSLAASPLSLSNRLLNLYMADPDFWTLKLHIKNKRCLCIDIILNTSIDSLPSRVPGLSTSLEPMGPSFMVQVAHALSNMQLNAGRIRISILDTLRMKTFFERKDVTGFDWKHAQEVVTKQNPAMIEADILKAQKQMPKFLLDTLNNILNDNACAPGEPSPLKIVILLSSEMRFAESLPIPQIAIKNPKSTRFFYFCLSSRYGEKDDLIKMLKPSNPQYVDSLEDISPIHGTVLGFPAPRVFYGSYSPNERYSPDTSAPHLISNPMIKEIFEDLNSIAHNVIRPRRLDLRKMLAALVSDLGRH
jgi:hypothetical protein